MYLLRSRRKPIHDIKLVVVARKCGRLAEHTVKDEDCVIVPAGATHGREDTPTVTATWANDSVSHSKLVL